MDRTHGGSQGAAKVDRLRAPGPGRAEHRWARGGPGSAPAWLWL